LALTKSGKPAKRVLHLQPVAINSPDNGIKEKAISYGADPRMSVFFVDDNKQHKFIAAFHGIFVFDRSICEITTENNLVRSVKKWG
jgi:hypothetical protein